MNLKKKLKKQTRKPLYDIKKARHRRVNTV